MRLIIAYMRAFGCTDAEIHKRFRDYNLVPAGKKGVQFVGS